jgi:hypothetical protein
MDRPYVGIREIHTDKKKVSQKDTFRQNVSFDTFFYIEHFAPVLVTETV